MRVEQIGDCTLYNGDCAEIMPTLGRFDLCLTDPPYGIAELWAGEQKGKNGASRLWGENNDWDKATCPNEIAIARGLSSQSIIWGGNYYDLPPSRGYLIWDKMQKFSNADSEYAWCSWNQTPRTFRFARAQLASEGKEHPTQKPLTLMAWCLAFLPKTKTVLDPFMGSGTTGVACARSGLSFTGIERQPSYFDIACRRIEAAYKQADMFVAPPAKPETGSVQIYPAAALEAAPPLNPEARDER